MILKSVRDLKLEVLETIIKPIVAESVEFGLADGTKEMKSSIRSRIQRLSFSAGMNSLRQHRSMALGITRRGNEYKLAIRIQRQALMHSPLVEQLVAKAKGEVDIKLIGRVDKRLPPKATALAALPWNRADMRPMVIGASIGHHLVTAGTIAAFVKDDAGTYVLSNNHVLANENNAQAGDAILQRASSDGGQIDGQSMATLSRWIALDNLSANTADAAIASVNLADIDPTLLRGILNGSNQILRGAAPPDSPTVYKIGRTTGVTEGRITAFEMDNVVVGYGMGEITFNDAIEIESASAAHFSDGGDSGSLILNSQFEGVGLLFAGSDTGGSNGLGVSYANSLLHVLEVLNVQLIT